MDLAAIIVLAGTLISALTGVAVMAMAYVLVGPQRREAVTAGDYNEVAGMEKVVLRLEAEQAKTSLALTKAEETTIRQRMESATQVNRLEVEMQKMVKSQVGDQALISELKTDLADALEQLAAMAEINEEMTGKFEGVQALYLDTKNKVAALDRVVEDLRRENQILQRRLEAQEKANGKGKANG